jgi:cadmium resistance protein CadD (predicted permease)
VNSLVLIVPVAIGAFVATNLDNLALLAALLARYPSRRLVVGVAYIASVLMLGLGGYGIAHAADIAPVEYLGWLGLIPIGLGTVGVIDLFRKNTASYTIRENASGSAGAAFIATLASQLGNGVDTVLTFGALFADSNPKSDALVGITVAAMAVLFLAGARYAVGHPAIEKSIENQAHKITPFILIFVGAYILVDTATDVL